MAPQKNIVDLRSDTVTRPTPGMMEAMCTAAVGDDVYGEDPTVNALETKVASLLGKDAALFVPSGTMANQLAIWVHTRRGDSIIAEEDSHCFLYEAGAAAVLAGVQFDMIPFAEGLTEESIAARFRGDDLHSSPSRLFVAENTHNRGGGRPMKADMVQRLCRKAKSLGLATHCDGARIWNASVATRDPIHALAQGFDTVAVCFSKGLGTPVGSALCGPKDLITAARKQRKRLGGAMRQAGFLAACAIYALDHHLAKLNEDHRRMGNLVNALEELQRSGKPLEIRRPEILTNMVYFRFPQADVKDALRFLSERGVLMIPLGDGWLRAVTHLDIDDQGISRAIDAVRDFARRHK